MLTLLSIGQSLQKERKKAGMSIVELAFRTGLSRNTISSLESGHGNVELNTLISICHVLKLSMQFVSDEITDIPQHSKMQRVSPLQRLLNARLAEASSNDEQVTTFHRNLPKPKPFSISFQMNNRPISESKRSFSVQKKLVNSTSVTGKKKEEGK